LSLVVSPGEVIQNLSFKILAKDNTVLEISGDMRNSWIDCSWTHCTTNNKSSTKRKKPQLPESGGLPEIGVRTNTFSGLFPVLILLL
jgi:hypothetical protein